MEKKDENKVKVVISPKKLKKKQNWIVFVAILLMIFLILIIIFLPGIINKWFYGFSYQGLSFEQTKQGSVTYYSTMIPLTDRNYTLIGEYPLNLRNDPRKIDKIPSGIENNSVIFNNKAVVYITVSSEGHKCDTDIIAAASLANFLNMFGGLQVAGALDNETYAKASRIPYVTCDTNKFNTIIMFVPGNETKITRTADNCYKLYYNQCEMLSATERFELIIIEKYMSFLKK